MKKNERLRQETRRSPLATEVERAPRDGADAGREDLGMELSQEDRERMLRDDALQNQLPNPPKRSGIHWFWASMTNQYTPVSWYLRLGYRPVKFEELEGWAEANMRGKSGEWAGCISVNEMLLMKADETSYQRFMKIIHHDKPMQEQERLRDSMRGVKDTIAGEAGHDVVEDGAAPGELSGMKSLDRTARKPRSFEG